MSSKTGFIRLVIGNQADGRTRSRQRARTLSEAIDADFLGVADVHDLPDRLGCTISAISARTTSATCVKERHCAVAETVIGSPASA